MIPLIQKAYEVSKRYFTKFSSQLPDGIYAFDLFMEDELFPVIQNAMLQIYRGTYYIKKDEFEQRFKKPGNFMLAYLEKGKVVMGTNVFWHQIEFGILELGQGFSFPHESDVHFIDFAFLLREIHNAGIHLPLQIVGICRKTAAEELCEMFGNKITGVLTSASLRSDYEKILETYEKRTTEYPRKIYYSLYQILNYHCEIFPKRKEMSMSVPDCLNSHPILCKFWKYHDYDQFPLPFKQITIDPVKVFMDGLDQDNRQIYMTIWPICHPELLNKLNTLENSLNNDSEIVMGTVGAYFYYEPEDMFIPGIILGKGKMKPYLCEVEMELDQELSPQWRSSQPEIQERLKNLFYGYNVTDASRNFIIENPQIYSGLGLDPTVFRGMTYKEKKKVKRLFNDLNGKISNRDFLEKTEKILQLK